MSEELQPQEIEFTPQAMEVMEEIVEAPKEEIKIQPAPKKAAVKKVMKVVQKKPKTYRLQVEGGEVIEVAKADFDKATMTIK